MSHEPKSSLAGMISTAPCAMATVSPMNPSPISGAMVANGSPASQSAHSGFAAALRKLAKQAEEPKGSISSESSHVSSPVTNHISPVSTPKRVALGTSLGPPTGTPPVVTIAPTKTVNGFWRDEGHQADAGLRGSSQERLHSDRPLPAQEKTSLSLPQFLGPAHPFSMTPSALMQDPRLQTHLSRQVPHMLLAGAQEAYLHDGFRPYTSAEELRMPLLPFGLSPGAAADALAYLQSGNLPYHSLASYRMEDYYSLSALRSPYYQHPEGGTLPSLHPSAVHLPMPSVFYPADIAHQSLSALHSERLQMEEELHQQGREREREKERTREIERESEWEQEVKREKEREQESDIKKERVREIQAVKAMEKRHLSHEPTVNQHLISHTNSHSYTDRQLMKDRAKLEDRLATNRPDKTKETSLLKLQSGPYLSSGDSSISTSGLGPSSGVQFGPGSRKSHRPLVTPMMLHGQEEDDRWLARQRGPKMEKVDRQGQASFENQHQVQGKHLDFGRATKPTEPQRDLHRYNAHHKDLGVRDLPQPLRAPPPLISPKPLPRDHHPSSPTPSTLWNPISLLNTPSDRPLSHIHPFSGHTRLKTSEDEARQQICTKKPSSMWVNSLLESGKYLAEMEKSTRSFLSQQRAFFSQSGTGENRQIQGPGIQVPAPERSDPMLVYDQALQQDRRLVSKLDLEEKKRKEAREKGYYYELDDSYDESDEEEVRAHLRRVSQQPSLKLDTSKEKMEFLGLFGLSTLSKCDELLEMKRKKRKQMMQERVPSPTTVQNKRKTPPPQSPLTTRYTPEEMDNTAELEDKKHFLSIFSLDHVSLEKRKKNEKIMDLLEAIKQKNITLDTLRYASDTTRSSPSTSVSAVSHLNQSVNNDHLEPLNPSPENPRPPDLPPLAPLHAQDQPKEASPIRGTPSLQASAQLPLTRPKDHPPGLNGLNGRHKVWENINPKEFAQHFHQSVLQSTQTTQHKQKVGATVGANKQFDMSKYHPPDLQSAVNKVPHVEPNGRFCRISPYQDSPGVRHELSAGEDISEDENGEDETLSPRWKGIESIFEAYQEYIEERSVEHQVLHSECRRLETQHYNLTLTAEQLSQSMRELLVQKHNLSVKRDHMQAELEHLKKCLALPLLHWHREYYKRPSPR
ncbi:genetic suppressor element 1-like isoform X1 [Myxocyprinus asiaticus]|uniref:genetic suppressor element 1-like isoform X1 n=1 Tax=Myxocyprinus asiaticus TaxID=70543 RepID=UPI0022214DE4|nr:genetic suppressor element 1-like isoform X1 [Myxocyprinus asiaticus]XP_051547701.1 genetic suppressor element 1-like isoform X1 [Myxocyprinus asiaticus]XP_051547702.1 genetic suppressor element 1-like isoform X1 [Myxocyprinus asiaticus]